MIVLSLCSHCRKLGTEGQIGADCPNLFSSAACCGSMERLELAEHLGLHSRRLNSMNPMEYFFAMQWQKENAWRFYSTQVLASLLGRPPSQLEATVAATVVQWLGSNIGRCFILSVEREFKKYQNRPHPVVGFSLE